MLDFLNNNWLISAILTSIALGSVAFINKIFAERKYNQQFSAMVLFGIMTCFSLIYLSFFKAEVLTLKEILLTIIWGMTVAVYSIVMMTALRYLPTSTYFINVRLISSFVLLFIGVVAFHDQLSNFEIIGFVVGVLAMILLFEKEKDSQRKSVGWKGILILLFGSGVLIFGHTVNKLLSPGSDKVPTILALFSFSAFVFLLIISWNKFQECRKDLKSIFLINILQAAIYLFYFITLMKVYRLGDLGISYKIQSYSPFIPIVLAAIVYKEKISFKKKIALVLVAISLWFFM